MPVVICVHLYIVIGEASEGIVNLDFVKRLERSRKLEERVRWVRKTDIADSSSNG